MKRRLCFALTAVLLASCGGGGDGAAHGKAGSGGEQAIGGESGTGGALVEAGTGGAPVAGPPAQVQGGITVVSNAIATAQGMRLVEQGFESAPPPCRPVNGTVMCLQGGIQP